MDKSLNIPSLNQSDQLTKKGIWKSLVQTLVRPPKHTYSKTVLGPQKFNFFGKTFRRLDINVKHQNEDLELSLFEPQLCLKIVILYLHGNSSCRIQAFSLIEYMPEGYALACFDFLGCGNSKDQYISLGVRQSQQIKTVVQYLQMNGYEVVLWGRSMGAASCLKYGGTSINIVDSPFSSLKGVCKQTAQQKKPNYIPDCMITCLFPCVYSKLRSDVKNTANFDMNQLNILKQVEKIDPKKTIIFISGLSDTLINHKHSQKLYQAFPSQNKKIFLFAGTHNSKRPAEVLIKIFDQIVNRISIKKTQATSNMFPVEHQIELVQMSHVCRNTMQEPVASL